MLGKTYSDPKMFTVFPWRADTPDTLTPTRMTVPTNSFHVKLGRSSEFPSSDMQSAAVAAYQSQTTIIAGEYRAGGANTVEARMQVCLPINETDDAHYRKGRGEKAVPLVELFEVSEDTIAEGCTGASSLVMTPVLGKMSKDAKKKRAVAIREAAEVRATQEALARESRRSAAAASAGEAPVSGASSAAPADTPASGASSALEAEGLVPYQKRRDSPVRAKPKPKSKARPASWVGLHKKGT